MGIQSELIEKLEFNNNEIYYKLKEELAILFKKLGNAIDKAECEYHNSDECEYDNPLRERYCGHDFDLYEEIMDCNARPVKEKIIEAINNFTKKLNIEKEINYDSLDKYLEICDPYLNYNNLFNKVYTNKLIDNLIIKICQS